jgi:hypothetical protein
MSALDAQLRYIHILSELAPEWSNPLSTDSALLVLLSVGRRQQGKEVLTFHGAENLDT